MTREILLAYLPKKHMTVLEGCVGDLKNLALLTCNSLSASSDKSKS